MMTLGNVSIEQLKRVIEIREEIESLQREFTKILGGEIPLPRVGKGKMSAAGRAAMSAAAKARWKKAKAAGKSRL